MVYEHSFQSVPVRTGDIICTRDGDGGSVHGALWKALGTLVPGPIDHCAIYVGPGGRCVEAGARGVIAFEMGDPWDAFGAHDVRWLLDTLYGVAYPLAGRGLSAEDEAQVRASVAAYALAQIGKPYNPNFLAADDDSAFYCSQLVYKAYHRFGIDLNANRGVRLAGPLSEIVFPLEIWESCRNCRTVPQPAGRAR